MRRRPGTSPYDARVTPIGRLFSRIVRSFWLSVLFGCACGLTALWLLVWYSLATTTESWAGLMGVFVSPLAAIVGCVFGGVVHLLVTWRERAARRRDAAVDAETRREDDARDTGRARLAAYWAAGAVALAAVSLGTSPRNASLSLPLALTLGGPLILAALMLRKPQGFAVGFGFASSVAVSVALLGTALLQASLVPILGSEDVRTHPLVLIARALFAGGVMPLIVMLVLCVTLARSLAPAAGRIRRGRADAGSRFGLVAGAAIAVAWLAAGLPILGSIRQKSDTHLLRDREDASRRHREHVVAITQGLHRMLACVERWARDHPDGDPSASAPMRWRSRASAAATCPSRRLPRSLLTGSI